MATNRTRPPGGKAPQRGRRLRPWGRLVIGLSLALWLLFSAAQPAVSRLALAPEPNPRLGIAFINGVSPDNNQPYANAQARYDKAKSSGAAFTRWPLYWHLIQPSTPDQFNYSSQDQVADQDIRNGLEVDAILMGTPPWGGVSTAEKRPRLSEEEGRRLFGPLYIAAFAAGSAGAVPVGLELPPFKLDGSINQENRWAYFVYKTVRRYMPAGELAQQGNWPQGKGIRYWEMWNEPDFTWANQDGQQVPVFWEGGVQNYYRLLKVGYLAAKAADPQATVVLGGLQYWSDPAFFTKVLDEIFKDPEARSRSYFFDAAAFHLYINPYNILNVGQWARAEMTRRGFSKAVWINEANLPVYDDNMPDTPYDDDGDPDSPFCPGWQGTMDEQASFVLQAHALAIAAGVERLFTFQLYDDYVGYREYYGLVRNDGASRPSFTAHQVAATYFVDPLASSRAELENGAVDSVSFFSPRLGKVTVLWNTRSDQKTVSLPASTPTAQVMEKNGKADWVTANNNTFAVTLPGRARYEISGCTSRYSDQPGSPKILVERVYAELSSRVKSLPEVTSQSLFPVTWSRLDQVGGSVTYDIQYRVGQDGQWVNWLADTSQTSGLFGPAQGGKTYYFRSRARMGSLEEPYPEGNGDAFTTVKLYLSGRVLDNRGRPVSQATVAAATPGVGAAAITSTNGQGAYSLEMPKDGTYQVAVSKEGYGSLPPKSVAVTTTTSYDFSLPPKDNLVQNWGFEGGMTGWVTSGTVLSQTFRHTGDWGATISKSGTLSQTVTVTGGNGQPTLSFFYRSPSPGAGDRFEVALLGNKALSYIFPLSRDTWQQGWLDASGLQGKVEIRFRFTGEGNLWLDEVSLGSSLYWLFLPKVSHNYSSGW